MTDHNEGAAAQSSAACQRSNRGASKSAPAGVLPLRSGLAFEPGEYIVAVSTYGAGRILQVVHVSAITVRLVNIGTGRETSIQESRLRKSTGATRFRRIGHGLDALREAVDCSHGDRLTVDALKALRGRVDALKAGR